MTSDGRKPNPSDSGIANVWKHMVSFESFDVYIFLYA